MEQISPNLSNDLTRPKLSEAVKNFKASAEQGVVEKVKYAATATDDYVQGNPWAAVSIAAGVGIMLGFITAKR